MDSNHSAIEREVQRRLVDAMVSAGVPQGRISLEVLYFLPTDFVRAYRKLHEAALLETVAGAGGGDPGRSPAKGRTVGEGLKARAGGRRYRTWWSIRSERAFRLKGSVDRKLLRLAKEIDRELADLRRKGDGDGEPESRAGA